MNRTAALSKNRFLVLFFLCASFGASVFAQGNSRQNDPFNRGDTIRYNAFGEQILSDRDQERQDETARNAGRSVRDRAVYFNRYRDSIQVYKIISHRFDTTLVDTSLTIRKFYSMNPSRRDMYGYMPYPNLGEGYTPLIYDYSPSLTPRYGMASRSMYYREADQVNYFDVRTPWSQVMYHSNLFSTMTGQVLDFNFTTNIGRQTNFSMGYRGKRTIGLYNYSEVYHGQLVGTFSYHTKSYRYILRSHFMYQFLSATENGGLTPEGMEMFFENVKELRYRRALPVNLSGSDAQVANRLGGSRFYLMQSYDIFHSSVKNPNAFRVSVLNEIQYEHRTYKYYDPAFTNPTGATGRKSIAYYGSSLLSDAPRVDSSHVNILDIAGGVGINFPLVNVYAQGMIRYQTVKYEFPGELAEGAAVEDRKIEGNTVMVNLLGRWRPMKYFGADASFDYSLSGVFSNARILRLSGYLQLDPRNLLRGSYTNASYHAPLTARYYRSSFSAFNWDNDFSRIQSDEIAVELQSEKVFDAQVKFTKINNYVYFDSLRQPVQYDKNVHILAITLSRNSRFFGWLGWDNTLTYQNVGSGSEVMPLPEFIIRTSVYADFTLFRSAVRMMPAFTLNYYTAFSAPMYNPFMSDYNLQAESSLQKIGNYPFLEASISAKVRRTRLFIKVENLVKMVSGNNMNYFSGPNYPSTDPVVRVGVVWDWFN